MMEQDGSWTIWNIDHALQISRLKDSIEMFNGSYYSPAKDKCIEFLKE